MRLFASFTLLTLAGCPEPTQSTDRLDEMQAEIEALQAQVASLQARLPTEDQGTLVTENGAALLAEASVGAANAYTDAALQEYATQAYVDAAVAAAEATAETYTNEAVAGYATEDYCDTVATAAEANAALYTAAEIVAEATARNVAIAAALGGYATESYCDSAASTAEANAAAYAADGLAVEASTRSYADLTLGGRLDLVEADYVTSTDVTDVVRVISADTVWSVATESELQDAIAALHSYHVAATALVTIEIAAGAYYFAEPLRFHHPDGGRVKVVGDTMYPENVNIYFSGSDGIVIDEGSTLGYLAGLSLHGDGTTEANGLTVRDGSFTTISALDIDAFGNDGIYVYAGSFLLGGQDSSSSIDGWLTVTNSGAHGVVIDTASGAYLPRMVVEDSNGDGVVITSNSTLEADYSASRFNGGQGFFSYEGSWAQIEYSEAADNAGSGYYASLGAGMDTYQALADGNVGFGFIANNSSLLYAHSSTATGNDGSYYSGGRSYLEGHFTYASSATGYSYNQAENGFLLAVGALSDTSVQTSDNDVDNFILGL